jgi:hypothetical protein
VWAFGHATESIDEDGAVRSKRADQVGEIFAFDDAGVFHAFDGIVTEGQGSVFDLGEPSAEATERERVLLARVDDGDWERRAELRASALCDDGEWRMRDRQVQRGPRERRRD